MNRNHFREKIIKHIKQLTRSETEEELNKALDKIK